MEYLVFDKDTNEMVDVLDFANEEQLKKYQKAHNDQYLEPSEELEDDLVEYEDFLDVEEYEEGT